MGWVIGILRISRRQSGAAILVIVCIVAGTAVILSDIRPIYGLQGLWHVSGMYGPNLNVSYSVVFNSVNFTFVCEEEAPLDAPIPIHFRITFGDGSFELLNTSVGGMLAIPPRVVYSNHISPAAAIVSSIDSVHWYEWYYAVSV